MYYFTKKEYCSKDCENKHSIKCPFKNYENPEDLFGTLFKS